MSEKMNAREKDSRPRWLALVVILILVIGIAFIVNEVGNNIDSKITGSLDIDNGDEKIDWSLYPTFDVNLSESLSITRSGTYHLTGELEDGLVSINVNKNEPVKLILDNVTIRNTSGPVISCIEGDDLVVELIGESVLEDNANYDSVTDEDIRSAIYSKADLTLEGEGTLYLTANHEDGIVSKDDLKINAGTYYINAVDDALRGKDSVYIKEGKFELNSGSDAIKSTNEETFGKGFVSIDGGKFLIKAGEKGIEAVNNVVIKGGRFEIISHDDAIHSNSYVGIYGGEFTITSGDDGIHADRKLQIEEGDVSILQSYEGLEAQAIDINGGTISVQSSDDGINAGGGADESANNRPGANHFNADENCILRINGGKVYINSAGDGVDSNGYLMFGGGNVIIDGPTDNSNGALDSGLGITMIGGNVIAVGSSGMAENLGEKSTAFSVSVFFETTYPAETKIEIKDLTGKVILSHTSKKPFSHLAAGSEEFIQGETYSIYINNNRTEDFVTENIVTTLGNSYDIMKQRR